MEDTSSLNDSQQRPRGRKSKRDEKTVSKLEEAFKADFNIVQACAYAGITKQTYFNWIKRSKKFAAQMEQAKLWAVMVAKKNIAKAVMDGSVEDSWKLLRLRESDRYAEKHIIKTPTADPIDLENPPEAVDLSLLTDDELAKFTDLASRAGFIKRASPA